ncbi:MAG TPA: carboxypeptidase regulatory-like domain-containing protein [Terriglobia bacterium]|nr:carboxypeptidase regulatory-like domain-containing protein [Terriglobia bacterium]
MGNNRIITLVLCLFLLSFSIPALCQTSAVNGGLSGTVYDASGGVIPGAQVTITGPTGSQSQATDSRGNFVFHALTPGTYGVDVEKSGFKSYRVTDVAVNVNQVSAIHVVLTVGATTQTVEVSSPAVRIDTSSTNVTTHITSTDYSKLPLGRNVSSLFYVAPGVASGLGTGEANPSISGASGLENTYVADGVSITDAGYHAFGIWSEEYGPVGVPINMAFVKEVNVKTAAFGAQYGGATGGIVQITTKSGTSNYHGDVTANFAPEDFEATRLQAEDFGLVTKSGRGLHLGGYDVAGEFGGPVPGIKRHLFFFGAFDPTWNRQWELAPPTSSLIAHGPYMMRTNTYSYASKLTYQINDNHRIDFSYVGDPSHTGNSPWRSLTADNTTRFSNWQYGSRNLVAHYTGTLSPTWLVAADFSWNNTNFAEIPSTNLSEIIDETQTAGLPGQRGEYTPVGLGFEQNTRANTYAADVSTTKMFNFLGGHTLTIGYRFEEDHYNGDRLYSGPTAPIPATNAAGDPITNFGVPQNAVGQQTDAEFMLLAMPDCPICPQMNVPGLGMTPVVLEHYRGIWGPTNFATSNEYNAAYIQDSWRMNRHITVNLGLRTEQQRMTGIATHYSFTDNYTPQLGVVFDPTGDRKTKLYFNYARLDYVLPLDMALRSLSTELDFQSAYWAPASTNSGGQNVVTINKYGTVTPVMDAAHLLTGVQAAGPTIANAGIGVSQQAVGEAIAAGTKMEYNDEYTAGIDQDIGHGVIFSARYINKRLKRLIEDGSQMPPELFNYSPVYDYVIGNLGPGTDLFTNAIEHVYTPQFDPGGNLLLSSVPSACFAPDGSVPYNDVNQTNSLGAVVGSACFNPTGANGLTPGVPVPDGVPDGFSQAIRDYDAVVISFNKSFANNWLMLANWRYSRLFGNYEGAFRNDNGQADPGISSLFDFTTGKLNLLGDQFKPGPLNTDRLNVLNFYAAYTTPGGPAKGLTIGPSITMESGVPINQLAAHPAYLNPGEVPLGGRGALGRMPVTWAADVHLDYTHPLTEHTAIDIGWDFFNIANHRTIQYENQNIDLGYLVPNPDFQKPDIGSGYQSLFESFQQPFHMRGMVRLEF